MSVPPAQNSQPGSPVDLPLEIFGLKSDLICPGEDILLKIRAAFEQANLLPQTNDILVIAESALATSENRVVLLDDIQPSVAALEYEKLYQIDAREAELVISESDVIFGGVFGVLLTLKDGMLCPNAGIDNSNAPEGCVILYPENPTKSARKIAEFVLKEFGVHVGVIIADSRTQPLRLGCTGVAIGAAGFLATVDKRGETDLFGRPLAVTRVAVADNLASAAEAVMGESNESTPFALIRNANAVFDSEAFGITTISPEECMYWGVLKKSGSV
ncbi:coenzyme F420-0:L-glutamate ligase [Methanimicrococcus blatticola]|uniref:Coenzyme F420-0 gamma-glutamyl ligase n=1 Tax=Methanimicrococcus blatticola TaxID=91560 RepID=A0A484F6V5_9EURY|nr:coenzyme F420-0:L-glutamate ligase [Methanimicrococcus blatticola]MBZ3935487.1 coenzyme F420-0:L-glutamate ligase [Methanimicrococcus blatticola]MCC2509130.1 coenzyme F420-0:L-glutamate ligase [Methanimicrococcus blatticola]TDQ69503.1 coenzyme F420-0 gamma-glutamyl ligase [Methanimicrococcus blatticola]